MLHLLAIILTFLFHSQTAIVLLQNDTEMRANGGFTGSYAIITTSVLPPLFQGGGLSRRDKKGVGVKRSLDIKFQDIYVPSGQIDGHINPPPPIQEAFKQGTWLLPNFDYEPDFPTVATAFRWYMEKGKEVVPDTLFTLNLFTIKKILAITGPLKINDQLIDSNNV